jgi:CDGSH-type Zn-finger protein
MSDVTVTVKQSGPLLVAGPIQLFDADDNAYTLDKEVIALCRCGQSANKPFCDGSHKTTGFTAEERAS